MELIAGDIGGTSCRLAWVTAEAGGAQLLRFEREYPSAAFATADALIRQFVADAALKHSPDSLLLALPGPMRIQRATLTNLDWTLDAADMRVSLGIPHVRFINDFQAAAAGVATQAADDMISLNAQPVEPDGVRAVTGAGTGLGLAFMLPDGHGSYRCYPSEGGHIDFAPANARQAQLLEQLRTHYGHVSWERVVSGLAMNDLYRFCRSESGALLNDEPVDGAALAARANAGDPAC